MSLENRADLLTVYTCISGQKYDILHKQPFFSGIQYVGVVDAAKTRPNGWHIIEPCMETDTLSHAARNRFYKMMKYDDLGSAFNADYSLYIDGNVRLLSDPLQVVGYMQSKSLDLALFRHPVRTTVVSEMRECMRVGLLSDQQVHASKDFYEMAVERGFRDDLGLGANYVLFRRNGCKVLKRLMSDWWASYQAGVTRDQLSLMPLLQSSEVKWAFIDQAYDFDRMFHRVPHGAYSNLLPLRLQAVSKKFALKTKMTAKKLSGAFWN